MNLTIGEVAKRTELSIDTLRYYDKEGLLPFVSRDQNGRRIFKQTDLNYLEVIKCLKISGIPVKEIKQFMEWCVEGDQTLPQRRDFFNEKEAKLEAEIQRMKEMLAFLQWKKWYYQTACEAGTESIHFLDDTGTFDPAVQAYYNTLQTDPEKVVQLDAHVQKG